MALNAEYNHNPADTPNTDTDTGLINTTQHDNDYIVATATIFGLSYTYVFKPRFSGYTLGKFRVNGRTYNQPAAGDTDLPGERAAAERAFHAVQTRHDVTIAPDAIGHKAPCDLAGITPDEFTNPASDHTDQELSLTLNGIDDDSNVTLTQGDRIYDYHPDTTYEVGIPHHRGRGACAREVEFRKLPDAEYRTRNLSHVDTKLARGRWEVMPMNAVVHSSDEYTTDGVHLAVGDVFTDLSGVADGLTDRGEKRITAIRTIPGVGTRVVLTPETSLNFTNDLNIRAVPVNEFVAANPTRS